MTPGDVTTPRTVTWRRPVLAGAAAVLGLVVPVDPPDLADFAAAGARLLDGHPGQVYDDGWMQAGPLQLVLSRLLLITGPHPVLIATVNAALVLTAMSRCDRRHPGREIATGLLVVLWLAVPLPWDGHPVEAAVPVLWAYTVKSRRRTARVLALGVAVMIAPWALLGFPCLLAVERPRRAVVTALSGAVIGVAAYLPFVATGRFRMFAHVWPIADHTLAALLLPAAETVTWPMRLVQGVLVAGCCAGIALRRRDGVQALTAAALVRAGTDPVALRYYWTPVAVCTVLLLATIPGRWWWRGLPLAYGALLGAGLRRPVLGAALGLILLAMTPAAPTRSSPGPDRRRSSRIRPGSDRTAASRRW
ncbi:hypothetical protein [Actinoplanes sp. NBRC 101535]|uniref:hypothetical protein n=1 Tax=Actinoplanes sp. NBRC 101535 TaxID=3032196 RepID=UPI0024A0914E|nr:hypothetical protein [Actinoplanes sp. NBRC 101535]GLX99938.1 hypothetical protein Acsp01_03180 [Actinoplanes sp. NBRC 101535]